MITSALPIPIRHKLEQSGFLAVSDAVEMVGHCDIVIAQYEGYDLTGIPPDRRHREMRKEAIETIEKWLNEVER